MIAIIFRGNICKNVNSDDQLSNDLSTGWRQLTDAEITAAGMMGYEHLVCPVNTTIGADGSITFTPPAPNIDEMFAALRTERDARLMGTDKYLLADYPISAAYLEDVKAYRTALRNLPDLPGAPWDGGGTETPWPELPKT